MASHIQLLGRVIISAKLHLKSGLRIGATDTGIVVSSVNTIIRDPITNKPYIPGSSIKGKLRSLFEKAHACDQHYPVQKIKIHVCTNESDYLKCPVCPIFGIPADEPDLRKFSISTPTRLVVRDAHLNPNSEKELKARNLDSELSELKTEVAIDRLTSHAVPRTQERIPAGTVMDFEAVFSFYDDPNDIKHFLNFRQALLLLEQDYLGGSGSRGYGQVVFKNIKLVRAKTKSADTDGAPKEYEGEEDKKEKDDKKDKKDEKDKNAVAKLLADNTLEEWLREKLETPKPVTPSPKTGEAVANSTPASSTSENLGA